MFDDRKHEDLLRGYNLGVGLLRCADFQFFARIPLLTPSGPPSPRGNVINLSPQLLRAFYILGKFGCFMPLCSWGSPIRAHRDNGIV